MPTKKLATKSKEDRKKTSTRAVGARVSKPKISKDVVTTDFDQIVSEPKPVNRRRMIFISLIVVGLGVVLFMGYKYLVIAWVDKSPITRIALDQQLEQKYGKDLTEQLISEQLILTEAKNRGVSAKDQDIDAEVKRIETQQGGADKLAQALQLQGLTMTELRRQLMFRLLIEKMFGQNINITDQQVDDYIAANKQQFASSSDQIKQQVKDQLRMQKIGQDFNAWLSSASKSNRVIRY